MQGLVRAELDCAHAAVLYIGMVQGLVLLRANVLGSEQALLTTTGNL